ncbi:hypothetical protein AB1Y20_005938 [Prymnesium parvum]|uniref:Uncharacterized protein n=1 Tax=Prymnesium parvum TaxID=97485 RepID=A0AB34J393_PRYPA
MAVDVQLRIVQAGEVLGELFLVCRATNAPPPPGPALAATHSAPPDAAPPHAAPPHARAPEARDPPDLSPVRLVLQLLPDERGGVRCVATARLDALLPHPPQAEDAATARLDALPPHPPQAEGQPPHAPCPPPEAAALPPPPAPPPYPFSFRVVLQEQYDLSVRAHIAVGIVRGAAKEYTHLAGVGSDLLLMPPPPPPPPLPPLPRVRAPQAELSTLDGLLSVPELASKMMNWPPYKHHEGVGKCTCRLPPLPARYGLATEMEPTHRWPCARAKSVAGYYPASIWADREEFHRRTALRRDKWDAEKEQRRKEIAERIQRAGMHADLPSGRKQLPALNISESSPGRPLAPHPPRDRSPRSMPTPRSSRYSASGASRAGLRRATATRRTTGRGPRALERIQARVRGRLVRKRGYKAKVEEHALIVQKMWRGHSSRVHLTQQMKAWEQLLEQTATLVQSGIRAWIARGRVRTKARWQAYKEEVLEEIISNLSGFDAMRTQLERESARTIQAAWRERRLWKQRTASAVLVQKIFRGSMGREYALDTFRMKQHQRVRNRRRDSGFLNKRGVKSGLPQVPKAPSLRLRGESKGSVDS